MSAYSCEYSYGSVAGLFKNPAEVAGPICKELRDTEGGLTPERLLEVSRPENAPLHNEFDWDDTIAAEKWRKSQASCIIRHLIMIETETDIDEVRERRNRAFVSTGENDHAYVPIHEALSVEKWKANLLAQARADMEKFRLKYRNICELANVLKAIDGFLGEEAS